MRLATGGESARRRRRARRRHPAGAVPERERDCGVSPGCEAVAEQIDQRLEADAQHEGDWAAALTSASARWDWVVRD